MSWMASPCRSSPSPSSPPGGYALALSRCDGVLVCVTFGALRPKPSHAGLGRGPDFSAISPGKIVRWVALAAPVVTGHRACSEHRPQ